MYLIKLYSKIPYLSTGTVGMTKIIYKNNKVFSAFVLTIRNLELQLDLYYYNMGGNLKNTSVSPTTARDSFDTR